MRNPGKLVYFWNSEMDTSSIMEMMTEMLSLLREIANKLDDLSKVKSVDEMMKVDNYYEIHIMSQNNNIHDNYNNNKSPFYNSKSPFHIENYINSDRPSTGVNSPSSLTDDQRVSNLTREYKKISRLHSRDVNRNYSICLYNSESKSYYINRSSFNQDIIRLVTRNSFEHFTNEWGPNIYPVYALSTSDILAKCACSEEKIDLNISITMFNHDNIRDYINLSRAIGVGEFNVLQFIQNSIDAYKAFITENISNRNTTSSAIDKVLSILAGFGIGFLTASAMT